jgi:DNA replication and repair protein RecF
MIVATVRLRNFRNHAETELRFGDGINVLVGDNGQGKTNIVEAVSYLSLTKSFFGATDATVLRIGCEDFDVWGTIMDGRGIGHTVRVGYGKASGEKEYVLDGSHPERLSSVIGEFPVVILSPEHGAVTSGGPGERRKFIDLLLSQTSRSYLEELLEYRRVLKHRNRVLVDEKAGGHFTGSDLEPWTAGLVHHGSKIILRRQRFFQEFLPYVKEAYATLAGGGEDPHVEYAPSAEVDASDIAEEIAAAFRRCLEDRADDERRRGMTLVGPHRDDVWLAINGRGVQEYASQGQHKTLLVALKLAEFFYLRERRNDVPLFLLDDVFSELDRQRSGRILDIVAGLGQTVITTTDDRNLHRAVEWSDRHRRFVIEHGTCRHVTE